MILCIVLLCLVAGLNSRELEQDGDHVSLANSRAELGPGIEGQWHWFGDFFLNVARTGKHLDLRAKILIASYSVREDEGNFINGNLVATKRPLNRAAVWKKF